MRNDPVTIKRALISVSDKSGLAPLAKGLAKMGVEIISTGGSGKYLTDHGVQYTPISEVTGNPEAFSGRMKTISFQIASGLLFRRYDSSDQAEAKELKIAPIDLVVCNLYPFAQVVESGADIPEAIENIDIGGPTMLRAAAKNMEAVTVITNPDDYPTLLLELDRTKGSVSFETRRNLALKAFKMTSVYDTTIFNTLEQKFDLQASSDSEQSALRYGENPHQKAWVRPTSSNDQQTLASTTPLQGKKLSYNNFLDSDAAIRCCADLVRLAPTQKSVTIIKHSNPCGAATGGDLLQSLQDAWAGDPVSAFGSIITLSEEVDDKIAYWLSDKFVEVVIAPAFSPEALAIFGKKKNLRLLALPIKYNQHDMMSRSISGGHLIQSEDYDLNHKLNDVTKKEFPTDKKGLAQFGIVVCKHLRSNAICLVHQTAHGGYALSGAGMGNPNRLISHQQAFDKARQNGHQDLSQMVLISDAFFPFADNIQIAHAAGVRYIIQPGGSIKDKEVIAACNQQEVSMSLTNTRHFRH
jgi:phosphoribosylaminoimidazolecarboxamide formyltransferase / IMP cyclohydrolase